MKKRTFNQTIARANPKLVQRDKSPVIRFILLFDKKEKTWSFDVIIEKNNKFLQYNSIVKNELKRVKGTFSFDHCTLASTQQRKQVSILLRDKNWNKICTGCQENNLRTMNWLKRFLKTKIIFGTIPSNRNNNGTLSHMKYDFKDISHSHYEGYNDCDFTTIGICNITDDVPI